MKLKQWLFERRISITDFARLIKISRCYAHQLISGRFAPSKKIMDRIKILTSGYITQPHEIVDKLLKSQR